MPRTTRNAKEAGHERQEELKRQGKEGQNGQEAWEGNTPENRDRLPKSHG